MRRNLTLQNAARVALALGAVAMLGGYWSVQQQKISDLQTQIDQLPTVKDKDQLDQFTAAKDKVSLVKDRITLENSINGSAIQAFGGLLLVVTACVSWKNFEATQEKQVTERFTQAINQLGSKEITVRVGGIYALERIAKDSEKDHWAIMEVLTSFIQMNTPLQNSKSSLEKIPKDIQAALTVIGRRESLQDPENRKLDLSEANLSGANLTKANLSGANLTKANLSRADLRLTHLIEADLSRADLRGVELNETDLTNATLRNVDLRGAKLRGAKLDLTNADLSFANLCGVAPNGVALSLADMSEANLILEKIKTAKNYKQADYDEDFQQQLGLPPKPKSP